MIKYKQTALILLCSIAFSGSTVAQQKKESTFYILGAVRYPGPYRFEGRPSVLQLIQAAGGLTNKHTSTPFIIRESQTFDGLQQSRIVVDPNGLTKGTITEDPYLQPGDIVLVPPLGVFFVSGEVNAPGSFTHKEGITLRQAISLAQGTTFDAVRGRVYIIREDAAIGKRKEMQVDLGEVMKGKKEDVAIEPGDIIVVPSRRSKSIDDLPNFIDTPPLRGLPSPQNGSQKKG